VLIIICENWWKRKPCWSEINKSGTVWGIDKGARVPGSAGVGIHHGYLDGTWIWVLLCARETRRVIRALRLLKPIILEQKRYAVVLDCFPSSTSSTEE
jgi:hypothetical protein